MSPEIQWYLILLLGGLLMVGAEVFVPGGILGMLGGLFLLGAILVGFWAFESPYNVLSALGILIASGLFMFVWIKYFPRTRIGRSLTLSKDAKAFKSSGEARELLGTRGTAQSDLRPAGIAVINGRRIDVVAEGRFVEEGTPIQVIRVKGNIVTVRKTDAPPDEPA